MGGAGRNHHDAIEAQRHARAGQQSGGERGDEPASGARSRSRRAARSASNRRDCSFISNS
jgi:hypothetical protein